MSKQQKLFLVAAGVVGLAGLIFVVLFLLDKKAEPTAVAPLPGQGNATTSPKSVPTAPITAQTDCTKLSSEIDRNQCVSQVSFINSADVCKQDSDCLDRAKMNNAIMADDKGRCIGIVNKEILSQCQRATDRTLDSDADGITDYNEVHLYFTNPDNRDTDGDGHSDGEEINNSFNPCGSGAMPLVNDLIKDCAKYKK
jgi:hypothetical protein